MAQPPLKRQRLDDDDGKHDNRFGDSPLSDLSLEKICVRAADTRSFCALADRVPCHTRTARTLHVAFNVARSELYIYHKACGKALEVDNDCGVYAALMYSFMAAFSGTRLHDALSGFVASHPSWLSRFLADYDAGKFDKAVRLGAVLNADVCSTLLILDPNVLVSILHHPDCLMDTPSVLAGIIVRSPLTATHRLPWLKLGAVIAHAEVCTYHHYNGIFHPKTDTCAATRHHANPYNKAWTTYTSLTSAAGASVGARHGSSDQLRLDAVIQSALEAYRTGLATTLSAVLRPLLLPELCVLISDCLVAHR